MLLGAGCASTGKQAHAAAQPVIPCPPGPEGYFPPPKAPQVFIQQVREDDTSLRLTYTYSGSCKPHRVELCWTGDLLLSAPAQVRLWLLHDSQGDTCKDLVTEERVFDTALLRQHGKQLARCEPFSTERRPDVVGCFIGDSFELEALRRNQGAR